MRRRAGVRGRARSEAELAPDDDGRHHPKRPAWLPQPVLREAAESDAAENLVDQAVELEQLSEDDPYHGDREDVREE